MAELVGLVCPAWLGSVALCRCPCDACPVVVSKLLFLIPWGTHWYHVFIMRHRQHASHGSVSHSAAPPRVSCELTSLSCELTCDIEPYQLPLALRCTADDRLSLLGRGLTVIYCQMARVYLRGRRHELYLRSSLALNRPNTTHTRLDLRRCDPWRASLHSWLLPPLPLMQGHRMRAPTAVRTVVSCPLPGVTPLRVHSPTIS